MADIANPYEARPWLSQYGDALPHRLPVPPQACLPALAKEAASRFASCIAFTAVMPNGMYGSLSYAEVDALSDAFAVYLRETLGLQSGDRVAIQMPNCLSYPVVLWGTLKAACVAVNTNPLYTPREMAQQLSDSGAKAIVIADLFADKLEKVLAETPVEHVVTTRVSELFPPVVGSVVHAVMKYWNRSIPHHAMQVTRLPQALAQGQALAAKAPPEGYWSALTHDDLALLQYTGGTTGKPKGAMLSHGNLLWNVEQVRAMARGHVEDGKEVILTALPLYHIFAFTVNFLSMFAAGARNILVPNPRPVQFVQRALENYPISWITGVNTLYNALLNEEWFTTFPPKHIKVAGGGGASMHQAVVQRWEQLIGAPLVEGYGLTETSPVVCFQPLVGARTPGTIGIPVPMTEVRLVDAQGRPVPVGEAGELTVRGPQVMQGYWQRPEETAKVLRDGWLFTGDVAVMDPQGTFKIVDRKKDLILVSGFNVYPNEVEDALALHDKVLEAAVIGVPDAKTGEAVHAYVVKRDASLTEAELFEHCRTLLTGYKRPSQIVFREELPKTPVGKILRRQLREELLRAPPGAPSPERSAPNDPPAQAQLGAPPQGG